MSSKQVNLEDSGCVTKNYPFEGCEEAEKWQQHISESFRLKISLLLQQHKFNEIRRQIWNKLAEEPKHRWCPVCSSLMVGTLNVLNTGKVVE